MILIGLGSNRPGAWGSPAETILRAVRELESATFRVRAASSLYETAPLAAGPQPAYANAVLVGETSLPPEALLRRLKQIERRAGRRSARPWGPRSLDLDLLDYNGRVAGWRGRRGTAASARLGRLSLPHPRLHRRPFVLGPLLEVAPRWRHPVLGLTVRALWAAMRHQRQGRLLKRLGPRIPTADPRARLARTGGSA